MFARVPLFVGSPGPQMRCRLTRWSAAEEKGGRRWRGISRRERDAIRVRLERFEKAPFIERGLFVDTIFSQNK